MFNKSEQDAGAARAATLGALLSLYERVGLIDGSTIARKVCELGSERFCDALLDGGTAKAELGLTRPELIPDGLRPDEYRMAIEKLACCYRGTVEATKYKTKEEYNCAIEFRSDHHDFRIEIGNAGLFKFQTLRLLSDTSWFWRDSSRTAYSGTFERRSLDAARKSSFNSCM